MASAPRFDELVFLDDFFRSPDNALPSHPSNRRFLHKAFRQAASRLGIACREEFARSDGGRLDVAAMMDALGLARTPAGWAKASAADLTPAAQAGLTPRLTPRTLVIGWGLTPSLMHFIDRSGAAFLDLEISPVRFTSNLAFCARTNDRQIEAALGAWHVSEEMFWNEASVLEGYFSRRSTSRVFDRDMTVGLFCGQTALDLSLVRDGEIACPIDFLDEIRALARSVDLFLIKPHPYEVDLGHLTRLADQIPNVAWTNSNIYALMCADNLNFVSGLSSGALREAAYFLKRAVPLIDADRNRRDKLPAACSDWLLTEPGLLSMQGLSRICGCTDDAAQRPNRFPVDALDRAFGVRWGWDAQSPGLRAAPELAFGQLYDFQFGQPATAWLSFGWSAPEGSGVWTEGPRACIAIPLARGAAPTGATELRAQVEGLLFVGTSDRNPTVRAWTGGRQADVQTAGGTTGETEVRFVLKAPSTATSQPRVLVLEFDVTDPLRPSDCGLGADTRRLGFHLQRLSVEWIGVAAEATVPDVEAPATPLQHPAAPSVRHAAKAAIAAAVCVAALAAALPSRTAEPAQSVMSASRWHQLQHTLALGWGSVRDDLHTLLRQHG